MTPEQIENMINKLAAKVAEAGANSTKSQIWVRRVNGKADLL